MSFTKESPEFTGYNLSYNETEVKRIMKGTVEKMEDLLSRTHAMQSEIRDIYLQRLKPKRDRIRDSCLLQKEIVKDIAVNSEEFAPMAPSIIFVSGIVFGIVLIALIATLTVRFSSDNF